MQLGRLRFWGGSKYTEVGGASDALTLPLAIARGKTFDASHHYDYHKNTTFGTSIGYREALEVGVFHLDKVKTRVEGSVSENTPGALL